MMGVELRWDPPVYDGDYLHDRQRDELMSVLDDYNATHGSSGG